MKPQFAHLSPTLLAFAAAIAVSLSVFLLSGAGSQGTPTPLLPALGSAVGGVAVNLATGDHGSAPAPVATTLPAEPVLLPAPASPPATHRAHRVTHRAHRVHHVRAGARPRAVRHAPPSPVQVPASAPAPVTPISAPQAVSVPKSNGKALGHHHGHAAKPAVAPRHGNGRARGHSPGPHHGLPPGHAKKAPKAPPTAPAAPAKAKGGGPPAEHGGGNSHNGNGHKGDKK
jgi:hypothetical protein